MAESLFSEGIATSLNSGKSCAVMKSHDMKRTEMAN